MRMAMVQKIFVEYVLSNIQSIGLAQSDLEKLRRSQ